MISKIPDGDYEKRKNQWNRFVENWEKALATDNQQEMVRLFLEIGKDEIRADLEETGRLLIQTVQRIPEVHEPPTLPHYIHSIMEELRDIGVWNGSSNTTYDRAIKALWSYENDEENYWNDLTKLSLNLTFKYILPFSSTARDPLKWFLERGDIINLCNHMGVNISPRTLRAYQGQGLIRPPVRLGGKAHYSFLTVFRILSAADHKRSPQMVSARDMVNGTLKTMLGEFFKKFPDDRKPFEDAGAAMLNIVKLEYGTRFVEDELWKLINKE
jgi:hypothetical protein